MSYKVMLVDRNKVEIETVRNALQSKFQVITTFDADEAMSILSSQNVDMLFADLGITLSNGAGFLEKVRDCYPDIPRIILGDNEEDYSIINAISHNYARACIVRPWDINAEVLAGKIFSIEEKIKGSQFFKYFLKMGDLPTINASYQRILNLIDNENDMEDIAGAIGSDPSMAAKFLRIVNSAYYGIRTTSIKQALVYLGTSNIRDLVMSTAIFDIFNTEDVPEKVFQSLWQQSFACSKIVTMLYKMLGKRTPSHAALAGLLMNIGMIFLLKQFSVRYLELIQEVKQLEGDQRNLTLENMEIEMLGATHAEIGGYLLKWWEIPYPIVEAAIFHHTPFNENVIDKEILCVVHIAEHYSAKLIYMDSNSNDVEKCFHYLKIDRNVFENKLNDSL